MFLSTHMCCAPPNKGIIEMEQKCFRLEIILFSTCTSRCSPRSPGLGLNFETHKSHVLHFSITRSIVLGHNSKKKKNCERRREEKKESRKKQRVALQRSAGPLAQSPGGLPTRSHSSLFFPPPPGGLGWQGTAGHDWQIRVRGTRQEKGRRGE